MGGRGESQNSYWLLLLTLAILMISSQQQLDKQQFQEFDEKKNSEDVTENRNVLGFRCIYHTQSIYRPSM